MMRVRTKTMLRRRGASRSHLNRGKEKRDPRSMLRSQAWSHRHFWLECAAAWRLIEFNERLHGRIDQ